MSLENILEVVLLAILTAIIGFYFPNKFVEHAAGEKVSRKAILVGGGILALVLIIFIFYPLLSIFNPTLPDFDLSAAILFIAFTVAFIHLIIRQIVAHHQLKREKIILDLGRIDKTLVFLMVGVFLLNFLFMLRTNIDSSRLNLTTTFGLVFYISVIVFWLIQYFSRVYLTDDGMVHSLFRTKWDRISSYQWGKPGEDTIPLTIKGGRETKVHVPVEQQAEVEALFEARHVQQLAPVGSGEPPWKKNLPDYEIEFRETMDAIKARRPKPVVAPLVNLIVALMIDGMILIFPIFYLLPLFLREWALALGPYYRILTYAIIIGYLSYFNSGKRKGQTIGQKLMSIAVADRNYNYLSIGRSFLRALLFCIFFILFQWKLPLLDNYIIKAFSAAIIAGMVLSLLYSYVFNGATRQGLHDLLIGSYVVVWPPVKERPLPKTPKAHLVFTIGLFVLGFLLFGGGSLAYSELDMAFRGSRLEAFEKLETALEQDDRIIVATVTESPTGLLRGERPFGGTLIIDVWTNHCVRYAADCEDIYAVITKKAFQTFPTFCGYSTFVIKSSNRIDIGIDFPASGESTYTRPISELRRVFPDVGGCI